MSTKDIVYVALFAALTAALGIFPPITVPVLTVPITAQTLGVMLAGAIAGSRRGGAALLLFVLLVAAGLPLLSGGRGGMGIFASPSGGFILSWPIAAWFIGFLFERFGDRINLANAFIFIILGGIGVVYLLGVPWVAISAQITFAQAIVGSAAFIPGDVIKAVFATIIYTAVARALPDQFRASA